MRRSIGRGVKGGAQGNSNARFPPEAGSLNVKINASQKAIYNFPRTKISANAAVTMMIMYKTPGDSGHHKRGSFRSSFHHLSGSSLRYIQYGSLRPCGQTPHGAPLDVISIVRFIIA
jgi:hypothetical protein